MKRFRRILKALFLVVCVVIVLTAGAVGWVFYGSLPDYSGHAHVSGLSATVRIYRDEHGVPHIFADTMNDSARALGYVHASERMFQMEMQRRAGQGRLAEIIGAPMLGVDTFIRTLGLYGLAESSFAALSPEAQDYFQAYADGVNAWIEQHHLSLPPEFVLLRFRPEPWKPADSLVWGKLMALQLSKNYKLEMLRATLAKKSTPAEMKALFPAWGDAPVMMQKAESLPSNSHFAATDILGQLIGLDHPASNEWVISGQRTDTGKPILANDPHLSLNAPILWYLARIVTPYLTLAGATVPGLPVIVLGQNNAIAWGITTTGSDVQDLFIETVDPKNPSRYLTPKGHEEFSTRTETIHVKDEADVTLTVRATRHGPVLSDIDPDLAALAGSGKVMALAFTGLGARDTTAESLMRINRVASWTDFLNALKLYQSPPQNIVFASAKGDIGFINAGLVPVRKKGNGLMPVEGASGAHDWSGMVPFDHLPQKYNPPLGFIFNANNALVVSDAKPYLGVDWEEPYRAERLQNYFTAHDKQTLAMSAELQADHVSNVAKQLLPALLRQKPNDSRAAQALDMLRLWDGDMDRNRPEPLIFEAWLYEMHRILLTDKLGDIVKNKGPYAATSIAFILAHDGSAWCHNKNCDDVIQQALTDALVLLTARDGSDMAAWRWGHEHQATLINKVFTHIPFLRDKADIVMPSSGDFYTLDRGGSFEPDAEHPFSRNHGGGYRGIYDLSDPARSRFMIATGESGNPLSSHYRDLAIPWNDAQSISLTGSEKDFLAQSAPYLRLEP